MPEIVLDLLKYAFLIVLYIFVARAVRAVVVELRPVEDRSRPAARRQPARKTKKIPKKAVVVEGTTSSGKAFDLGQELLLGRGDKCHVVIDDSYVSTVHARIFSKGENYLIEDLGSTNGTYLNRRRITSPTEVQRGDQVKIGKTVLEMRR
ncbi:MAG: FHA domain-containing protein FhaB/FipA [Actinomycetota bacterium]